MNYARISKGFAYRIARSFSTKGLSLRLDRPIVSISFDDFPTSAWDTGGRILAHHGVRGSYYVSGNLCGTQFDGNEIIDASRLIEVADAGHEIGCHTFSHRALRGLAERDILAEFDANRAFLRKALPQLPEATTFAYPYGDVSLGAKRVTSRRFDAARGVFEGVNAGTADLGLLRCVCLEPHVLGRRSVASWVQEAVRTKGWLIFLTHDVSDAPGAYGVTPRLLDEVIRTALAEGCDLLPVRDALALAASRKAV